MTGENDHLENLAQRLDRAALEAVPVEQFAEPISVAQAYEVQRLSIARRLERGERRMGFKMGLTSKAKMTQVNVTEMCWGRLTDGMLVEDGGMLDMAGLIHPRVEPEVAFRLGAPLAGKITALDAWRAIDGVAPAIEILDSRFKNFKFRLTDVIADNTSCVGFVIGPWSPPETDFANLGMSLDFNGRPRAIGSSAAILGHPIRSLVAAADLVSRYGEQLNAGDIVMSGAATAAESLTPRTQIRVRVEKLGNCGFAVA
jgi:2-oxo-3-hexenedioate decarboxylase